MVHRPLWGNPSAALKSISNFGKPGTDVLDKLFLNHPSRTSIRGYIFIIAVDRSTDPPRFWPSSKSAFENGVPVNFKKGQSYKIRNFRLIRARWSFKSAEKTPSEIRILAYDRAGSLLLKEDFRMEKEKNR